MATKKKKRPTINSYKYREQFGVIVICDNEKHQKSVYGSLKKLGHKCKVVTV